MKKTALLLAIVLSISNIQPVAAAQEISNIKPIILQEETDTLQSAGSQEETDTLQSADLQEETDTLRSADSQEETDTLRSADLQEETDTLQSTDSQEEETDTLRSADLQEETDTLRSAGSHSENSQGKGDIQKTIPEPAARSATVQSDDVTFTFETSEEYQTVTYDSNGNENYSRWLYYSCKNSADSAVTLSVSSSNTKVLQITSDKKITLAAGGVHTNQVIYYKPVGIGYADIVVSVKKKTYKFRFYVVPSSVTLSYPTQTDYLHITLKWKKVSGCSGYRIERSKKAYEGYKAIKTVGAGKSSTTVPAEWNKTYFYRVVGYVKDDIRTVSSDSYSSWQSFTARKMAGASITSVKKSGESSLQIKWKAFKGATGYKLYRSTKENGTYKCIYTAKKGSTTSYKQKVSKGVTYYYKLITLDAKGKSDYSPSVSQIIPAKNKVKRISCSKIHQKASNGLGQYSYYWSKPDTTYYYQAGGKFHAVCVQDNGNLKIYTLNSAFKVTNTKTIKLSYDVWGGFYQGPDNNFYVAVGYTNSKESKTKAVIKVIKYNNKWKKVKTASIKGGASNSFEGIYAPFEAGNCRMDMQGSTLYLMTSRLMFMGSDGLRHQSNISFKINTKKMKAVEANESYASHSFNQFAKFKDHTLYLLDHGDAYPRCIKLTTVSNYGLEGQTAASFSLMDFQGGTGQNFTGCRIGGMEVGGNSVLACGTAQPHYKKIKNISGFGDDLKYNAFLALANRKSGKVTFKWLTTYNPKTTSVTVGETRMVKLSDNRFAVLYSTTQKEKSTLHYAVYSDTGKKIYSKKYSNMTFDGDSQPILSGGSIVWIAATTNNGQTTSKLYAIPAVF